MRPLSHALLIGLILTAGPLFAAGPPSTASALRIDGARLSLRADRLPLRELLAALERHGLARIEVRGDMSGIAVSDAFDDTDVLQALRRVLSAHSHLLIDRGASKEVRRIELILLTSPGGAADNPVSDLGGSVAAEGAAPEALAAEPAGEAPQDAELASQVLVEQLSDPDEDVRAGTLEALKDTGDAIPVDAVAQVAQDDASAERRIQALELLAERAERKARGPLRRALQDSDPAVRARAGELIEDWHLDSR